MTELLKFLQTNLQPLLVVLTGTGAFVSAYLYRTRHQRYGHKIGKQVVNRFRSEFEKKLISPHSQKSMQERVEGIKDMVIQFGLSEYIKDHNQAVSSLEKQVETLKNELELKKTDINRSCNIKDQKLEKEAHELESKLKNKEEELFQLKREEDSKNELLDKNNKAKDSRVCFFSKLIETTRNSLGKVAQDLETHTLRYIYAIVILLMLAGDYYITFFIFNDVLKIQFKDNKVAIYIFSGIIALVFLVLIERAMDLLEKSPNFKRYFKKLQTISMLVVGLILFSIYLLMVSLSWLNDIPEVLDSLLRLLFVPLIIAVAISIRKVQKDYGFSFLFTPFKLVLNVILIAIFNIALIFEVSLDYIRRYLQREKFESKTKMTVSEEIEAIRIEILRKNNLREELKQQLETDINKLNEDYQDQISRVREKLDRLIEEMAKIRKGCESGVVATLRLPVNS